MFKLTKRFIAYLIDMMVVILIAQTISSIPLINKNIDKYKEESNKYLESYSEYYYFRLDLTESFEDNKLSKKEYDELIEDNPNYKDVLDKYYKDEKLTKKSYDKLVKELDKDYESNYKKISYKLEKYNIVYNISYIVVTLLYFIGFNILTSGQTLGKKLLRLKIINTKDKELTILNYLIRCILLYQPVEYLIRTVFINFLSINNYYNLINIISNISSYFVLITLTFMAFRLDGRGLHDILASTKVISIDRNGNEIESKKAINL